MFCPKCATQNPDTAHFCRTCGANISLVPQALTGQLIPAPADEVDKDRYRDKRGREVSWERAFKKIFSGIAFLIVAIALSRTIGRGWWFWFLIPSFSMLATGLAQVVRLKRLEQRTAQLTPRVTQTLSAHANPEVLMPPASVTEQTTRHLNANERE